MGLFNWPNNSFCGSDDDSFSNSSCNSFSSGPDFISDPAYSFMDCNIFHDHSSDFGNNSSSWDSWNNDF